MNKLWRENLGALRDDWEARELSEGDLFKAIIDQATPETAAESLVLIGEKAASLFDLWFVARYGDHIEFPRRIAIGHAGDIIMRKWRVIEAFHRAVLDRREPL